MQTEDVRFLSHVLYQQSYTFVEEARSILMDSDIRLHLKLLTLSVLAFVNNPSCGAICKQQQIILIPDLVFY